MSKTEFDNATAVLSARMVSLDAATRHKAARDAQALLEGLPADLRNSPHCRGEIEALNTLIARVAA